MQPIYKLTLGCLALALTAALVWTFVVISGRTALPVQSTVPAPLQAAPPAAAPPAVLADTFRLQEAVYAYNRGHQSQDQQDYAAAVVHYQAALTNDPSMAPAWFNLGLIFAAQSNSLSARDAYENAIAAEPTMVAARYNLALMQLGEHDRKGALVQLREIVRLQPDNAAAYYTLGYALSEDPQAIDQAKQTYKQFLKLAPDDPNASNVRDWLSRH